MMLGDLPQSSSVVLVVREEAAASIAIPGFVERVKAILSTSGWLANQNSGIEIGDEV
jgi:hypothetical protein